MPHVRRGDTVFVIAGKEKGKRGKVLRLLLKKDRVVIERVMMVKRHTKPGQAGAQSGGIFEKEAPIPMSALMVIDPKTNLPTRVRRIRQTDGSTVRVSVRSGEELLVPGKAK